jgi:hypothetical protein
MQDLISSYLIQKKECSLPALGKISISSSSPSFDVAEKTISAPREQFVFSGRADHHFEGLVKYISQKKSISEKDAKENLISWCHSAKEKLNDGEKISLSCLGFFQKNSSGVISFTNEEPLIFYQSVKAERALHKNDEHAVLVGDRETTSSAMNQYLNEEEVVSDSRWRIISIVLLAIAVILLFIHFYIHSFSFITGNQSHIQTQSPAETYTPQ